MNYDVCKLKMLNDFKFRVTFKDKTEGEVKVPEAWLTGIFAPLKNPEIFKKAFINDGAVTWDVNGQILDLAPDTMYKEIKRNNGLYILGNRKK